MQRVYGEDEQVIPMYEVVRKLKKLKGVLKAFNKQKFSNIENVRS